MPLYLMLPWATFELRSVRGFSCFQQVKKFACIMAGPDFSRKQREN